MIEVVALFSPARNGIYTRLADVGADCSGNRKYGLKAYNKRKLSSGLTQLIAMTRQSALQSLCIGTEDGCSLSLCSKT